MKVFITGCCHFSSRKVLPFRDFESPEAQDKHFLEQINKYVEKQDRLYILGDFAMVDKGSEAKIIRDKIYCGDVRLVLGNHEKASPTAYSKVFQQVGDILEYRHNDQLIVFSHYPLWAWNQSFRSSWNFYSHLHNKCEPLFDHMFPDRRSADLGIDNAKRLLNEYRPFSLDEVLSLLKDRRGNSPDRRSFRVVGAQQYNNFRGGIGKSEWNIFTDHNLDTLEEIMLNFQQSKGWLYFEYPNKVKDSLWLNGNLFSPRIEDGNMVFSAAREIPPGSIGYWA